MKVYCFLFREMYWKPAAFLLQCRQRFALNPNLKNIRFYYSTPSKTIPFQSHMQKLKTVKSNFAKKLSTPLSGISPSRFLRKRNLNTFLVGVIGINTLVFLAWTYADWKRRHGNVVPLNFMRRHFLLSEASALQRPWTILTSTFSHMELFRIFRCFNARFWHKHVCTPFVRIHYGSFLGYYEIFQIVLYIFDLCRSCSDILQPSLSPALSKFVGCKRYYISSDIPGATSGIVAYTALANPQSSIIVLGIVPMNILLGVGMMGLYDIYGALYYPRDSTAHAAHLAGAAFGVFSFFRRF